MVRDNPRRPETNAGAQWPDLRALSLMDDPAARRSPAPHAERFTVPGNGRPGFPGCVYLLAAAIFRKYHQQKPASHRLVNYGKQEGSALPEVKEGGTEVTEAYELALNTLKYQELLEDILIDSTFYLAQRMPDEQMSLVAVMLYDFQDRKFLPREPRGEELIQEVLDVEDCLHRFKTKLAASLARFRVKHNLLSIDLSLPESLQRSQERARSLPLYAWVNPLRSSVDEVKEALRSCGFTQAPSVETLAGRSFCADPHCGDTLAFPAGLRGDLHATMLPGDHKLIIQEKLCGLGPHAAAHLLSAEGEGGGDLLLAGCFSGLSVSHAAGLVAGGDRDDCKGCRVLACVGDLTTQQQEELQGVLAAMGCKNVGLIPQDFQSLTGDDPRLQRVRAILLTPQCSVSAVCNPLDFILRENGDRGLLPYLSKGSVAKGKLEALAAQQTKALQHAFNFPKVRAVVYCTVSLFPEENQEVVRRCLEQSRTQQDLKPKLQHFGPSPVLPSFLAPPEGCEESFFRLEPTAYSNGCFLAVLTREPEPVVKETPEEVIRRANARGLLDKIGVHQPPARKAKKGAAARMAKETHASRALPPNPRAPGGHPPNKPALLRASSEGRTGRPAPGLDLRGWTNRRPALQAKTPCWQPSKTTAANAYASIREGGDGLRQSAEAVPYKGLAHAPPSALDGAAFIPFLTRLAPPTAPPSLVAVATPTRARPCLVLKSVALTLPPVQLPGFQLANHSRAGAGWGGCVPTFSCHSWRHAPSQAGVHPARASGSLHRDLPFQPRPWL